MDPSIVAWSWTKIINKVLGPRAPVGGRVWTKINIKILESEMPQCGWPDLDLI